MDISDLQPKEETTQNVPTKNAWSNLQLPTDNIVVPESAKFKKKPRQTIYFEEDEYKTDRQLRLLADLEAKINSHKNKNKKAIQEPQLIEEELPKAEEQNYEIQKQHKIINIFEVLKESEEDYDEYYLDSNSEKNKQEAESKQEPTNVQEKEELAEKLNAIHPVSLSNNGKNTKINANNIIKPVIHKPKKNPSRNRQKNNHQQNIEPVSKSSSRYGRVSFCITLFIVFCIVMLVIGCSDEIIFYLKQSFK